MMLRGGKTLDSDKDAGDRATQADAGSTERRASSSRQRSSCRSQCGSSVASKAASIRQRNLEAEIAAAEALFEKEKTLIMKRLELQKLKIREEEDFEEDDVYSRPFSISHDKPMATGQRTAEWVSTSPPAVPLVDDSRTTLDTLVTALQSLENKNTTSDSALLTKFLARQGTSRDLPSFNGDPEQWPAFITHFEQSTATCGFTQEENLLRLQKSLKGKAREAVSCILFLPNQLTNVIQTLTISFGRPTIIVKSMIRRVRAMPAPRDSCNESIITFSNCIKNLVATMKTLNCVGHMSNPQLVDDLLLKLPPNLRLQ